MNNMEAKEFLTENSDWFDKSPGGEKLYFESEVIRMMNEYANEALRIHDVVGQSEQLICDTCKSGLIDYPEINRRTCRCGGLGYNVTD